VSQQTKAMMRSAPSAALTPMPAFAPVDNPPVEECVGIGEVENVEDMAEVEVGVLVTELEDVVVALGLTATCSPFRRNTP
jgi:hypothetical protein